MFTELAPILTNRSVVIMLSGDKDGRITCNFVPKANDKDTETDKPLLVPLTLTATPQDLDTGLASVLLEYTTAHQTMQQSVEATKAQMAAAEAEQKAEAKRKADEAKSKGKKQDEKPAAKASKPATPPAPSLFDGTDTPAPPPNLFASKPEKIELETDEDEQNAVDDSDDESSTEEEAEAWEA